MPDLHQS